MSEIISTLLATFIVYVCVVISDCFLKLCFFKKISMTTAARPTFEPARGGTGKGEKDLSALSKQYSSRDLPSHTKLKYR